MSENRIPAEIVEDEEVVDMQLSENIPREGGTSDHTQLTNRDAQKQHPISAIDGLQEALDDKYEKPNTGIPKTDLAQDVQQALDNAITAIPVATAATLGGIKANAKTEYGDNPVVIGEDGFLYATKEIFVAEYGVTSFGELLDADADEKQIRCKRQDSPSADAIMYDLYKVSINQGTFVFVAQDNATGNVLWAVAMLDGLRTIWENGTATIPLATAESVGGVKADTATAGNDLAVKIKEDGTLATQNRVFVATYSETAFADIVFAAANLSKKVICRRCINNDHYNLELYELARIDDSQAANPPYAYFKSFLEGNSVKWVKATKSDNNTVWTSGTADIPNAIRRIGVSLAADGWGAEPNVVQTVAVQGMTATANVWVSPGDQFSAELWWQARIFCTGQGADSLTFRCSGNAPSGAVGVNVMWQEV